MAKSVNEIIEHWQIKFEWNQNKELMNINKHSVNFSEALTVFDDVLAKIFFDDEHSINEERFIIVGFSNKNRLLFVSYTERNNNIRIISARLATKRERVQYEKENNKWA